MINQSFCHYFSGCKTSSAFSGTANAVVVMMMVVRMEVIIVTVFGFIHCTVGVTVG